MATETLPPTADAPASAPAAPTKGGQPTAIPKPAPTDGAAAGTTAASTDALPDDALPIEPPQRKVGFMQTPWVQDVLPLATSIILHAGIIGLGFATYETYKAIKNVVEEQTIIPDAAIVDGAEVGGIVNPGLGGDPNMAAAQDEMKDVPTQSDAWASKPSDSLTASLAGAQGETSDNTIGIGPNSAFGSAKGAEGGVGTGEAGGGAMAPFGVPGGGGGMGPKFMGIGSDSGVRKVVYICDATGTMLGLKFDLLKQQLAKAVDILKPIQQFNVIFFRGGSNDDAWSLPMFKGLEVANPANKQKAFKIMNETSVLGAGTNPIPALKQAFAQKPQLIYFLTDGEFNNYASYEDVLAEVAKLNADKTVKVNTILMMSDDAQAEKTLKAMASQNGGVFKKVLETDLR